MKGVWKSQGGVSVCAWGGGSTAALSIALIQALIILFTHTCTAPGNWNILKDTEGIKGRIRRQPGQLLRQKGPPPRLKKKIHPPTIHTENWNKQEKTDQQFAYGHTHATSILILTHTHTKKDNRRVSSSYRRCFIYFFKTREAWEHILSSLQEESNKEKAERTHFYQTGPNIWGNGLRSLEWGHFTTHPPQEVQQCR